MQCISRIKDLHWVQSSFLVKSELLFFLFCVCVVLLCIFTLWVPCCEFRVVSSVLCVPCCEFRVVISVTVFACKWCSIRPVVCSYLVCVVCVCLRLLVSSIYCVVFLFCLFSSCDLCALCCKFLWIVHF